MAEYISFQPKDYFNTKLYTGTGATHSVTGVGFQPDFTWIKQRDGTYYHQLYDSVRGAGYHLASNDTAAQSALDTAGLSAWTADGFTVNTRAQVNYNTGTFTSWNWKGGTTSGITTDGSTTITPSAYSFSATSGFSVLAYTGTGSNAMLAHGLGVAPEMVMVKNLSDANDWKVYSKYTRTTSPEDWHLGLNSAAAAVDEAAVWNDTQPDTVNVSLGTSTHVNDSTKLYIAYCFASIKGNSKCGGYIGNANADGPFNYTGFRPSMVFLKKTESTAANWQLANTKMSSAGGGNVINRQMLPDTADTPQTENSVDLLSNGFKVRNAAHHFNAVGTQFIYAAFAEFPIVSSNDVPTVAR